MCAGTRLFHRRRGLVAGKNCWHKREGVSEDSFSQVGTSETSDDKCVLNINLLLLLLNFF